MSFSPLQVKNPLEEQQTDTRFTEEPQTPSREGDGEGETDLKMLEQALARPSESRIPPDVTRTENLPVKAESKRPRVLLADDQRLFLDGLRRMLEGDFEVIGTMSDGPSLVAEAERLRPDLVLLEVSLPGLDGIEAAARLRQLLPEVRVVFLAKQSDGLANALRAGGLGYVLKTCSFTELRTAMREALNGRIYVTPLIRKPVIRAEVAGEEKRPTELTEREREVLQLVAEGHSARNIAAILRISIKTVAFHKTNVKRKLEIHSTAALTKYALRHSIAS